MHVTTDFSGCGSAPHQEDHNPPATKIASRGLVPWRGALVE
jgi:hypothetical protein